MCTVDVLLPSYMWQMYCKNASAHFNSQENLLRKMSFKEVIALGQKFIFLMIEGL